MRETNKALRSSDDASECALQPCGSAIRADAHSSSSFRPMFRALPTPFERAVSMEYCIKVVGG